MRADNINSNSQATQRIDNQPLSNLLGLNLFVQSIKDPKISDKFKQDLANFNELARTNQIGGFKVWKELKRIMNDYNISYEDRENMLAEWRKIADKQDARIIAIKEQREQNTKPVVNDSFVGNNNSSPTSHFEYDEHGRLNTSVARNNLRKAYRIGRISRDRLAEKLEEISLKEEGRRRGFSSEKSNNNSFAKRRTIADIIPPPVLNPNRLLDIAENYIMKSPKQALWDIDDIKKGLPSTVTNDVLKASDNLTLFTLALDPIAIECRREISTAYTDKLVSQVGSQYNMIDGEKEKRNKEIDFQYGIAYYTALYKYYHKVADELEKKGIKVDRSRISNKIPSSWLEAMKKQGIVT